MTALHLQDIRKTYRDGDSEIVALEHATLSVADGEMVALMGPSGSGKSTLLSIAGGLLTPTSGEVLVGGEDISGYTAKQLTAFRRRQVGFVFQSVNLVPFLSARENLLVVSQFSGSDKKAAAQQADRLLEELGLSHRRDNLPAQLSGGERQRVAIGRALMNDPALVLVDEPTSALDSHLGEQVMQLLVDEIKGRGKSAVVVTHDGRITHFADRTVAIADGRLGTEALAAS
jgi:putative ABC transport system ATP-binding protein